MEVQGLCSTASQLPGIALRARGPPERRVDRRTQAHGHARLHERAPEAAARAPERHAEPEERVQGADLAAAPTEKHEKYDALNDLLRGRFGLVSLRGLLDEGQSIERAAQLLKGSGRRRLELSFRGCEAFDEQAMQIIADHLPPELEELDMSYGGLEAAHAKALASALANPASKIISLECAPLIETLLTSHL